MLDAHEPARATWLCMLASVFGSICASVGAVVVGSRSLFDVIFASMGAVVVDAQKRG